MVSIGPTMHGIHHHTTIILIISNTFVVFVVIVFAIGASINYSGAPYRFNGLLLLLLSMQFRM